MKDQLTEDAAGRLQTEVDEINTHLSTVDTHLETTDSDIDGLKNSVQNVEGMLAWIETTSTASRNYSAGDFLVLDGKLRRAQFDIAYGEEITNANTIITSAGSEMELIRNDLSVTSLQLKAGVFYKKSGNVHMLEIFGASMVDNEPLNVTPPNMNIEVVVGGTGKILRCGVRTNGTFICQNENGQPITSGELVYGTITWIA
jgi:hypothetical protein